MPQIHENFKTPPRRPPPSTCDLDRLRSAAATLHDGTEFDVIATLRYPSGRVVEAIDAEETVAEFDRRMMKRCYGRGWWDEVPRVGFPIYAVLESPTTDPHVHALFVLEAAGKRSKADAITLFDAYAERTWRGLVTGGSVWIDTTTSSTAARRYFAKTLGPDELHRLLVIRT